MKIYELIQELERRDAKLSVQDDGRLKIEPASAISDIIEEVRRHKYWLCEYALGRYELTIECVNEHVAQAGTIPFMVLSDRFPRALIDEAKRCRLVVEQANSWYRLPTESEKREYLAYEKRRRAA